ncbi:hypothetical protein BACCAP_04098 [Pseudoflavonifractor capillosus ATCC 29799]|uniref:Uncharacterized protein n=1 Tax=Pseudoflavonifractor capillosus ATCC 29799 TaxID=411467 RepID=A6P0T2_9FIRM|nr:hypothetical protein BACCAP_04098 [Pseudoflavonifractor capillosus ATCC 29799]
MIKAHRTGIPDRYAILFGQEKNLKTEVFRVFGAATQI